MPHRRALVVPSFPDCSLSCRPSLLLLYRLTFSLPGPRQETFHLVGFHLAGDDAPAHRQARPRGPGRSALPFMPTVELSRVSLLLFAVDRAFPASSVGRCCLALGIVLMLRGRLETPEAGRLVEIARPWRVRTASALRVQIPSVRDAHEDRSTSFPSLRGPTTGQLRSSRRPPAATPWQQSAARHGARPALSEGRCSAHVLWRHICSAAPAHRPR
jgi:hypothetical protein